MNCPKCNNEAIENQAMGESFWYCRTCKDEVQITHDNSLNNDVRLDNIKDSLENHPIDTIKYPFDLSRVIRFEDIYVHPKEEKPQGIDSEAAIRCKLELDRDRWQHEAMRAFKAIYSQPEEKEESTDAWLNEEGLGDIIQVDRTNCTMTIKVRNMAEVKHEPGEVLQFRHMTKFMKEKKDDSNGNLT
jgi:hypothetical protein